MRVIWGSLPRTVFFDDLHILRTLDRLEQAGQSTYLNAGIDLLTEVTGGQPVSEDRDYRSFIRELSMARDCGFLTFKVLPYPGDPAPPDPDRTLPNHYLHQLADLHLTPLGRDRARCRVYELEPPDPGEDDGRPITQLIFARIAEILAGHYAPDRLRMFLEDSQIPPDMIGSLDDPEAGLRELFRRVDGPSGQRRVLRHFFGRWLGQELPSGPNADEEKELRTALARQGWYVRDGRLVVGEPVRRAAVAPLLGGDLLANLHPTIQAVARPYFSSGHRAAAVLEACKAIELRVRELLGSAKSGQPLMSEAFGGNKPRLRLNQGRSQVEIDEQEGFALIFMGVMRGVRNPKAHALLDELDERRALDYLGLASLLMRRLDDADLEEAEPQSGS
jgi:uncharacterized protein (TIGR02391 family)